MINVTLDIKFFSSKVNLSISPQESYIYTYALIICRHVYHMFNRCRLQGDNKLRYEMRNRLTVSYDKISEIRVIIMRLNAVEWLWNSHRGFLLFVRQWKVIKLNFSISFLHLFVVWLRVKVFQTTQLRWIVIITSSLDRIIFCCLSNP